MTILGTALAIVLAVLLLAALPFILPVVLPVLMVGLYAAYSVGQLGYKSAQLFARVAKTAFTGFVNAVDSVRRNSLLIIVVAAILSASIMIVLAL